MILYILWMESNGILETINLLVITMGIMTFRNAKTEENIKDIYGWLICVLLGFLLALGPNLIFDVPNPVFRSFTWLPGMWRFAKPEIFLLIPYAIFAMFSLRHRWSIWIWSLVMIWYLGGLYSSPAYPYLSEFIEGTLHFTPKTNTLANHELEL